MIHPNTLTQWKAKFNECLALEFSNPEYFEVHHLLVLTYMLQTNSYSNDYFFIALDLLQKFLKESISPKKFLNDFEKVKQHTGTRNKAKIKNLDKFEWQMSIMQVRIDNAENYCEDVKIWANNVLNNIRDKV